MFGSDAGMVFNFIKPEKTSDFEAVVAKLSEALQKSDKPERKQQAVSWKVFRAIEPGANGSVLYVFTIDPAVKGVDYTVSTILAEAFPSRRPGALQGVCGGLCDGSELREPEACLGPRPVAPFKGEREHKRTTTAKFRSRDHATTHGVQHDLGGVVHVELLQDVRAVRLDRDRADREQFGNLFVAVSFGDQLEDLPLALGQRVEAIGHAFLGQVPDVVVEHHFGDHGAEERLAGRDGGHAANQTRCRLSPSTGIPSRPRSSAWMM